MNPNSLYSVVRGLSRGRGGSLRDCCAHVHSAKAVAVTERGAVPNPPARFGLGDERPVVGGLARVGTRRHEGALDHDAFRDEQVIDPRRRLVRRERVSVGVAAQQPGIAEPFGQEPHSSPVRLLVQISADEDRRADSVDESDESDECSNVFETLTRAKTQMG